MTQTSTKSGRVLFLLAVCQAGAEKLLKDELARERPDLRAAFQRPGFVTFKQAEEGRELHPDEELRSVFARAYALSIGKAAGAPQVIEAARSLVQGGKLRLHVFERDRYAPGEEPPGFEAGVLAEQARQSIEGEAMREGLELFEEDPVAREGDPVLSVVIVEESEWWLGFHVQGPGHLPFPGGDPGVKLPTEAPSRAYLKAEEAIRIAALPMEKGDIAVEIGSAPGGASYALLERGLEVIGIDPAQMDPRVLNHPNFTHVPEPVAAVRREQLPERVDWLLLDMNVAPYITLHQVQRLGKLMRDSLLGVVLTFKLNEPGFAAEIPEWTIRVKELGMAQVKTLQLKSNRREICIMGVTRKGLARGR